MKTEGPTIKILHLEDMDSDAVLVERVLKRGEIDCRIKVVGNRTDYIRELKNFEPDIILSDHTLPAFNSLEALEIVRFAGLKIPFILVTATVSEEFAVSAMRGGVDDYIFKDRPQRLPEVVRNSLEKFRLEREKEEAMKETVAKVKMMKIAEQLAHLGSWQVDLLEGTTKWSDELFRIYGYSPGEVEPTYELFLSHMHPEDSMAEKQALESAIDQSNVYKSEFRIIDKNGKIKHVRAELIIERSLTDKAIGLTGFNLDITEQKGI